MSLTIRSGKPEDASAVYFRFFSGGSISSLSIKNNKAQKKSVTGLSVMSIQLRPQILSLLSIEIPTVFNHIADIKKKMIPKLSMYLTTFMMSNNYRRE